MKYRVSPLMYSVSEDFYSTFRFCIELKADADAGTLSRAVAEAIKRYPYFAVRLEREGEAMVLSENHAPVVVRDDGSAAGLGGPESNGHLLAFSVSGRCIYADVSHFIADGMGIEPFLKTVMYFYLTCLYGDCGIDISGIRMPGEAVPEGEWAYPFPEGPVPCDPWTVTRRLPETVFKADPGAFDGGGRYAYHIRIPQKALMEKAKTTDGSPVSFLTVMLYRAICALHPELALPVVAHIQHQYRAAVRKPDSHDSLVSYLPAVLPVKAKHMPVDRQNTAVRGQVILGSEPGADLESVNRMLRRYAAAASLPLAEKRRAMDGYVRESVRGKTFGISYMGRIDWRGMERYIEDIHAYIGEKDVKDLLILEILTLGDCFTLTFMQSGRGTRYVNGFMDALRDNGIECTMKGGGRYVLSKMKLPEDFA